MCTKTGSNSSNLPAVESGRIESSDKAYGGTQEEDPVRIHNRKEYR
jgi:hypothetical protein